MKVKRLIQNIFLGIAFFVIFFVVTFPYSRLGPKMRTTVEKALKTMLATTVTCELNDFDVAFPAGMAWQSLECKDSLGQGIIQFDSGKLVLLPGSQSLQTSLGKGTSLVIKTNAGFTSPPTRLRMQFDKVPIERISPLLLAALNRVNPNIPKGFKMLGLIQGSVDIPLTKFSTANGQIDLNFQNFQIPRQSLLDLVGLKDLNFSKATIQAQIKDGKLNIKDAELLASQIGGKAEGQIDLQDDLRKSSPNLTLKWKVEKSDALLSAPLGIALSQAPCPSPDNENFCTRKIIRPADLFGGM